MSAHKYSNVIAVTFNPWNHSGRNLRSGQRRGLRRHCNRKEEKEIMCCHSFWMGNSKKLAAHHSLAGCIGTAPSKCLYSWLGLNLQFTALSLLGHRGFAFQRESYGNPCWRRVSVAQSIGSPSWEARLYQSCFWTNLSLPCKYNWYFLHRLDLGFLWHAIYLS